MGEFAKYYLAFLYELVKNIGIFFATLFGVFKKAFITDIGNYFIDLGRAVRFFDFWGWLAFVLVTLINFTFLFFLFYRVAQVLRRFFIFRAKEIEKDELLEQVSRLKNQVSKMSKEKNAILNMKLANFAEFNEYIEGVHDLREGEEEQGEVLEERFPKLLAIDEKYDGSHQYITMAEEDMISLSEIVERFRNFAAVQYKLYYDQRTVRLFIAGMASSKVIILEGISGTGKTSLPYAVSRFFSHPAQMVSVQPNWRDRAELLGYFNEFTKRFNETDFLASLYESSFRDDPCFIVLDEMNLARIEYYFADFLSVMEMPDHNEWLIDLVPNALKNDPVNLIEGKVFVPQNLWFIGTANQDDSTFTITDKVYDRAVTIGLNQKGEYFDAPLEQNLNISNDYLTGLFDKAVKRNAISLNTLNVFEELDEFIQKKFKIAFGNRIMLQIKRFIPIFVECGGSEYEGLDFMLASKILRKFTSLNLPFLVKEINELIKFLNTKFGQGVFKDSIEYLESLLKNM
ncbi:MAG: hypothetical protein ACOYIQ_05795 [Christensenellales bacterium]|jgi:hypothetical protein